jgi:hypothetical protein
VTGFAMLLDALTVLAPPWEALWAIGAACGMLVAAVLSGYSPNYNGDEPEDE